MIQIQLIHIWALGMMSTSLTARLHAATADSLSPNISLKESIHVLVHTKVKFLVNTLWPWDTKWLHGNLSLLVQVKESMLTYNQ